MNPNHVAIIMDGNGRWAEKRGLPRSEGHKKGAEVIDEILSCAKKNGVKYLTLYAFSTENWKRPPQEVLYLMRLLERFLEERLPVLQREKVRLNAIGRLSDLPVPARKKLFEVMEKTRENTAGTLTLCLSYGGRAEIVDAVKKALFAGISPKEIDEKKFSAFLYDGDLPDPDLVIRTSGELRLSNFLMWESAYSEFYFSDVLWPDFSGMEFEKALASYAKRDRRRGGHS